MPQAERIRKSFTKDEVAVIGLHMAFEKFDEQTPDKVQAFLKDSGIEIPVAYDKPNGEGLPQTMSDYELQGTPAILVFDRQGRLRRHYLGAVDDLRIGAEVMGLLIEDKNCPRDMSIAIESKLHAALVDPEDHDMTAPAAATTTVMIMRTIMARAHGEPGHVHGPGCKH